MPKQAIFFSLTLFFLLLFSGCSSETSNISDNKHDTKIASNNFTLKTLENADRFIVIKKTQNGFLLKNDPKKVLILGIYATWCPPCRAEAAVLSDIQKKYKNDITVIGLSIEEQISDEKLTAYKEKYHVDYTLVSTDNTQALIDAVAENLKIGKRFPIPLVLLYKEGKLVNYYAGATEEEFIESDIKQILGK